MRGGSSAVTLFAGTTAASNNSGHGYRFAEVCEMIGIPR